MPYISHDTWDKIHNFLKKHPFLVWFSTSPHFLSRTPSLEKYVTNCRVLKKDHSFLRRSGDPYPATQLRTAWHLFQSLPAEPKIIYKSVQSLVSAYSSDAPIPTTFTIPRPELLNDSEYASSNLSRGRNTNMPTKERSQTPNRVRAYKPKVKTGCITCRYVDQLLARYLLAHSQFRIRHKKMRWNKAPLSKMHQYRSKMWRIS